MTDLKKVFKVILMVLLVIGLLIGVGIGIAALTCLIFMLIIAGVTGAQITFQGYAQYLGEYFWGFLLLGFIILAGIVGIVNYFMDLAKAFAKEKEAKRVYKEIKKQNLDIPNMSEYQKEQYRIHKWHRFGYRLLAGICIASIIGFTILALLIM